MEPVIANVNYQMQPVVVFDGTNWAVFQSAFENYARQQGFYPMLTEDGRAEPEVNADRWRQRMAQATTALTSGWITDKMLGLWRHSNNDNAYTIYSRIRAYYGEATGLRALTARDRVERYRQGDDEDLVDFMSAMNIRVAELGATGYPDG
jgi:hypothetical protein